ncbi:hypothetical protein AAFF_G00414980 [Aldrovandia affinis]|uniref:Uncharacterized protein n=1 Tax=Aldrovandia affinis TaxID=143900 RepID=A0AAD7WK96_9TELE|nr:hypothetical protein AAFF_G00414980 [Aldrovandia affinis]
MSPRGRYVGEAVVLVSNVSPAVRRPCMLQDARPSPGMSTALIDFQPEPISAAEGTSPRIIHPPDSCGSWRLRRRAEPGISEFLTPEIPCF